VAYIPISADSEEGAIRPDCFCMALR
jgi:hypothetical protein